MGGEFEGRAGDPYEKSPGPPLKAILLFLSSLYALGARARRRLYGRGWLKVKRLPAPVVSVGNLTVGGAAKTPMVACLARLFQEQGKRVAILSRGYGGRARGITCISDGQRTYLKPPEVGEEAYWLARSLPGVAVYTGNSRYEAGLAAWQDFRPELFLLDDGFQHFQLRRDLDLVLLDAESPWGNGHLLPRGPLREPPAALNAAHLLILTRFQEDRHQSQMQAIKTMFPGKPVLTAAILPAVARLFPGGQEAPPETLKDQALWAFAGLARPAVFALTLRGLGVELKGFHAFPDHYAFNPQDLRQLVQEARAAGAAALITTTKDWARLAETWEDHLPLWVLEVEARLQQPLPAEVIERIGF